MRAILDIALERGQEITQQDADRVDLAFQSMIGIEDVQRRSMLLRPTDEVAHGNDVMELSTRCSGSSMPR